jgi:hypothetical protein
VKWGRKVMDLRAWRVQTAGLPKKILWRSFFIKYILLIQIDKGVLLGSENLISKEY